MANQTQAEYAKIAKAAADADRAARQRQMILINQQPKAQLQQAGRHAK